MTEEWYWDDVERMIFNDGKRVELSEEGVEIGGAWVLKAVRRVCKSLYRVRVMGLTWVDMGWRCVRMSGWMKG